MTEQEALFQLGQFDFEYVMTEAQREAYRMAIAALEKQIPKKPINITKNDNGVAKRYENCHVVKCSNCNGRLKMKSKGMYCDKCGQRIDWGNEE